MPRSPMSDDAVAFSVSSQESLDLTNISPSKPKRIISPRDDGQVFSDSSYSPPTTPPDDPSDGGPEMCLMPGTNYK